MSAAAHDNTSEPCLPHQAKVREANGVKGEVARVERTTGGLMRQLYHELGRLRRPSSFVGLWSAADAIVQGLDPAMEILTSSPSSGKRRASLASRPFTTTR